MCSFKRSRGNRVEQGGSGVSIQVNQDDPITSDQIRPNPTKIKPGKSESRWRVQAGTPGSHREHRGAVCSMAARKSRPHSRTCSACGSYQMSHCERFGLRRRGAVLDPAVRQVTETVEQPCSSRQLCFALGACLWIG